MISTVQQLVTDPGFLIGLSVTVVILLLVGRSTRPVSALTLPVVGSLAALLIAGHLEWALAAGVLLTLLPARWMQSPWLRYLLTAAALLVSLLAPDTADELVLIVLVIVGAIALQRPMPVHGRSRLVILLAGLTILGIWATIPDTDAVRTLVGAALGMVVGGSMWARSAVVDASGLMRLGVMMGALVLAGGDNRAGSIVGSTGALGMLLIGDSVSFGRFRFRVRSEWHLIGMHLVLVLVWSRLAGLRTSTLASVALGVPLTVLVLLVGMQRIDEELPTIETAEDS